MRRVNKLQLTRKHKSKRATEAIENIHITYKIFTKGWKKGFNYDKMTYTKLSIN
jgi:hypothetical protein